MISDEVQMLINRMHSNPEEFAQDIIGFEDSRTMQMRKWTLLMNSIVNNKPSLEIIFTPEELKALKQAATEILRPDALAAIVKTIVGGEVEHGQTQMEMSYTHPYGTSTITQTDILKMQATGQTLREIVDEKAKRGLTP